MHKLILATALTALLAGCAGVSGYTPRLGIAPEHNDKYWPPYDPAGPFPAQIMDGGSPD